MYRDSGKVNATADAFKLSRTTFKRHIAAGHVPAVAPAPTPPPSPLPPPEPIAPPAAPSIVAVDDDDDDGDDAPDPHNPTNKGRPCSICALPEDERREVEGDLSAGVKFAAIARQRGKGDGFRKSVRYHARTCIPRIISKARADDVARLVSNVRDRAESLMARAETLVDEAEGSPDLRARAQCLTAAKGVLELLAKLTGDLGPDVQINLLGSTQWQRVQDAIGAALLPYPEAMAAVVAALANLDKPPAQLAA